jgi:hypothetical protein
LEFKRSFKEETQKNGRAKIRVYMQIKTCIGGSHTTVYLFIYDERAKLF